MAFPIEGRNAEALPLDALRAELKSTATLFAAVAASEIPAKVQDVASRCATALSAGGKIVYLGNGGSAAEALHLAAEFVGRFERERRAFPALALPANVSEVTAIANDYEYAEVFRRQVEAWIMPGDVVFGLSTSGRSPNVLAGLDAARARGAQTVAITGEQSDRLEVDVHIAIPSAITRSIQEVSLAIGHLICGHTEFLLRDSDRL